MRPAGSVHGVSGARSGGGGEREDLALERNGDEDTHAWSLPFLSCAETPVVAMPKLMSLGCGAFSQVTIPVCGQHLGFGADRLGVSQARETHARASREDRHYWDSRSHHVFTTGALIPDPNGVGLAARGDRS